MGTSFPNSTVLVREATPRIPPIMGGPVPHTPWGPQRGPGSSQVLARGGRCWPGGPGAGPGQPTRVLTAAVSSVIAFFASAKNMLVLGLKYSSFSMPA